MKQCTVLIQNVQMRKMPGLKHKMQAGYHKWVYSVCSEFVAISGWCQWTPARPWSGCPCIQQTMSGHLLTTPWRCTEAVQPLHLLSLLPVAAHPPGSCPPSPVLKGGTVTFQSKEDCKSRKNSPLGNILNFFKNYYQVAGQTTCADKATNLPWPSEIIVKPS